MPDTVRTKINEIYSCLQGSDTPVKIDIQVDCGNLEDFGNTEIGHFIQT